MAKPSDPPPRRKGACRMADIPPEVLEGLNAGRLETITLVEWLAINQVALLTQAAADVGLGRQLPRLLALVEPVAKEGITGRVKGIGRALHSVLSGLKRREEIFERLATHSSDMVRAWAAYAMKADEAIPLKERIKRTRRFASDPCMSVRETAWDSLRPHLARDLTRGLKLLEPWVHDEDFMIRRCAVEGTRPCGVWTKHLGPLKEDPARGMPLLEPCRSDTSDYVRKAVANWINDASKSQPAWVKALCARWEEESPTKETRWIVKHGLRTLRKRGEV